MLLKVLILSLEMATLSWTAYRNRRIRLLCFGWTRQMLAFFCDDVMRLRHGPLNAGFRPFAVSEIFCDLLAKCRPRTPNTSLPEG